MNKENCGFICYFSFSLLCLPHLSSVFRSAPEKSLQANLSFVHSTSSLDSGSLFHLTTSDSPRRHTIAARGAAESKETLANMADSNNDHLIKSDDSQHPANLIPQLCRKFWHLGWVTGTGGGASIRKELVILDTLWNFANISLVI